MKKAEIKLLKSKAVLELENNFEKFQNSSDALKKFVEENSEGTKLEFTIPNMYPENDFESARNLFNSLKMLTTVQASDERIWIYLFYSVFNEYRIERLKKQYPSKEPNLKTIMSNTLFTGNNNDKIRAKFLNYLSRLWWIGYFFQEDEKSLELVTKKDFAGIMTSYFSTTFTSLKSVRYGTLDAVKKFIVDNPDFKAVIKTIDGTCYGLGIRNLLVESNRFINRLSSAIIVDIYNKNEISDLVYQNLIKHYCVKK